MAESTKLKYRAFISYSHADTRWAKWLHKRVEGFRVDKDLIGRETPAGPVPKCLSPVFRDRDEFTAGHSLTDQTVAALDASATLIAICSPASAKSHYVNEEIRLFKSRHPHRAVIPVIVAGNPRSPEAECFPPALRFKVKEDGQVTGLAFEVLAADVREEGDGQQLAASKVIASLLGLSTDHIYRRAERARRKARRIRVAVAASITGLAVATGFAAWQWQKTQGTVVEYDAALDQYCREYLEKVRERCDRQNLTKTFKLIANAAAAGADPRNRKALRLIEAGKSEQAAPILRELANEEAMRGQAAVKRAAERFRTSAQIAFFVDTEAAIADTQKSINLEPDNPQGWMQLGDLMFRVGNLEGSEQAYQKASSMYRQRGEHDYEKDAYISLGRVLQKRGSLGKAEEVFRKALVDIKHAGGSPIIEARALNAIGLLQIRQGDYEGALKSLTRATQIFSAAGDKAASALAQFNIGYLESSRGNDDRAMHIFQAFVKNGEPLRQDRLAVAYGNLGIIYYTKGWLEQAKEMYQKQLEIEKKLDRKEGIVASLQSLGNLASTQKSFIEAESLLKNALRIAEQHYLAYRVATTNIILGDVYQQTGKFAAAEACALRALSVAKQNNLDSILGNTYDNLGRLSERRGDLARARRYHSKALLVFEGQDNKPGVRLQKAVLRRLAAHRAQPH